MRVCAAVLSSLALAAGALADEPSLTIVVSAPGYPGNTEQARPTMDAFADGVARAVGWPAGRVQAVYHERLESGLERLARPDVDLALVPLPFYLEFRDRLGLAPLLEVLPLDGEGEVWSLVARRGALGGPAALEGWELTGMPGYSPRFVTHVALGAWAPLPQGLRVRFSARVLSALREAAGGARQAVLLDRAQAAALAELPFAAELEVVTRSETLPASLLCRVGTRAGAAVTSRLREALLDMHRGDDGRARLEALRVARFRELPHEALERVERSFRDDSPRSP